MIIYKQFKNAINLINENRLKYFYFLWFLIATLFVIHIPSIPYDIHGFPVLILFSFVIGLSISIFQIQFLNVKNFYDFCSNDSLLSLNRFYSLYFLYGLTNILFLIFPFFFLLILASIIMPQYMMILLTSLSIINVITYGLFLYIFSLSTFVISNKKKIYDIIWKLILIKFIMITFGGIFNNIQNLSFVDLRDNKLISFIDNLSILNFTFYYEEYCVYKNISAIILKFIITFLGYFILILITIMIDYYVFFDKFYRFHNLIKRQILLLNSDYKNEQNKHKVFSFVNMIKEIFIALLYAIIAIIILIGLFNFVVK